MSMFWLLYLLYSFHQYICMIYITILQLNPLLRKFLMPFGLHRASTPGGHCNQQAILKSEIGIPSTLAMGMIGAQK